MLQSWFLFTDEPDDLLGALKPEWNKSVKLSAAEKLKLVDAGSGIECIFPWKEELSEGIEQDAFCNSLLVQPRLFLRIRPGCRDAVTSKLQVASIPFEEPMPGCLSLPNATPVDQVLELDKEVVVQDYSSQRTAELMRLAGKPVLVWDCCAASGGKSILLTDVAGKVKLTVSDIRIQTLQNLKTRFLRAGISNYHSFREDLTRPEHRLPKDIDLIICDAPCTGSGTWARTPEQLYSFELPMLNHYAEVQRKILRRIIPSLKEKGFILYITCSVFKKENEEQVEWLLSQGMKLVQQNLLKGYNNQADTMFAALLQR